MRTDLGKARLLYWTFFKIGAFTFGGGYVIVPLMKGRFVDDLGWLEVGEMLGLTAIAQSAPGPIAVNAAILVGYRVGGVLGAALSILGTVLPPFLILSVISLCYAAFRSNTIVAAALKGMEAGVSAVIASVVVDMAGDVLRKREWLSTAIMVGAFVVTLRFEELNVAWILLVCALLGILSTFWKKRKGENA